MRACERGLILFVWCSTSAWRNRWLAAQVQAAGLARWQRSALWTCAGGVVPRMPWMVIAAGGLLRFLARQHMQDNLDELATVKLKRICTLSAS